MNQSLEERIREWTVTTWYFLHNGAMPDEREMEIYAEEALQWRARDRVRNRALVRRFESILLRHSAILYARKHAPRTIAARKSVDLYSIQTPEDRAVIHILLEGNTEYKKLMRKGRWWANNPSYAGIQWAYFIFLWPIAFLIHKLKERSHKAFLQSEHIKYSVTDAYFRSLDADEEYRQHLQSLLNDYWAEPGEAKQ